MVDKNVFTQELKKVFTILKEIRVVEKYVKELIDNNNLNEDKVEEFRNKLNEFEIKLLSLEESISVTDENVQEINQYIESIKDYIIQNDTTTEIGGNLEVDGNIELNSSLVVHENATFDGDIIINDVSNLKVNSEFSLLLNGGFSYSFEISTLITGNMSETNAELNLSTETFNDIKNIANFIKNNYNNIRGLYLKVNNEILGEIYLPLLYMGGVTGVIFENFQALFDLGTIRININKGEIEFLNGNRYLPYLIGSTFSFIIIIK